MGRELPDDVNLPPFTWRRNKRSKGSGSGKSSGRVVGLAVLFVALSAAFVLSPFVYLIVNKA